MVLANTADNDGLCPAETSIATVAKRTTLAKSSAAQALVRLRDAGVLDIESQHDETGATVRNIYRLTIKGCTGNRYTPLPGTGTPAVPESGTDPYREPVPPVPETGTPLTCEDAGGVPESGQPTSSLHPSDVVAVRAGAARTPARTRTRENTQPPQQKTPRRQAIDNLNATATRPETRRLITDWQASHHTAVSGRLVKQMTDIVDRAVRDNRDLECLAAALREWNCRSDLYSPKVLPGLYDDAVSRKNAGESPDRPLIDENGMPRIDPQQIPDSYLTREVVDAAMGGRDPAQAPPYPPDDDAYGPDGHGYDEAGLAARRAFYAAWADERLTVRRAELRRVMIRAWNRKLETTVAS